MKKCPCCNNYYLVGEQKEIFKNWLIDEGWTRDVEKLVIFYFDSDLCADCNKEPFFEKVPDYETCMECDHLFLEEDSRERFMDYLYCNIGYAGSMLEAAGYRYNHNLCSDCNISHFEDIQDEFEDEMTDPDD